MPDVILRTEDSVHGGGGSHVFADNSKRSRPASPPKPNEASSPPCCSSMSRAQDLPPRKGGRQSLVQETLCLELFNVRVLVHIFVCFRPKPPE